jgi:hypothetical protein
MDLLMAHCVKHGEDYKYDHKDFVFPLIFYGALLLKRRNLSVTVHDFLEQLCTAAESLQWTAQYLPDGRVVPGYTFNHL